MERIFLGIFLALSILTRTSSAIKMKKCCPHDEIVQMSSAEDVTPQSLYSCVKRPSFEDEDFGSDEGRSNATAIAMSFEFMGYNTLVDHASHWPACGDSPLSMRKLNEPIKGSELASCVDVMEDEYFVFTCERKLDAATDLADIYRLKKCCPGAGMSYDITARKCVASVNVTDLDANFREFLHGKVVLFENDVIKCSDDEVFVEYHSRVHDLKMFGSSLVITNLKGYGPEVFKRGTFCIESTLNSVAEKPLGMSDEHYEQRATSKFIAKVCRSRNATCSQMPCIRKCCKIGERMVYENSTTCEPHDTGIEMQWYSFHKEQTEIELSRVEPSEFGIIIADYCLKYVLEENDVHYFSGIDGSLYVESVEKVFSKEDYCVDYFYDKEEHDPDVDLKMHTFVCFNDEDEKYQRMQFHIYAALMVISAFFLGITFLVYIFLPKLLNLHGKTVVCHVISLFIGYTFLSLIQFSTDVRLPFCLSIAFIVYFGLFSAFSWLNVMCLDIYWTFGSVRASHGIRRTKEMKRFMYYSAYAWGLPFIMTIFTFMIDFYNVLPPKFQPNIGISKCWFEEQSSPGHLIFFLFPIGIQISINFILFILTAVHCNRIKAEIHRMQMCDNNDQAKRKSFIADRAIFIMNIKLFCVMGISWLLEIIATVYKQNSVWWHISDVFNCLQGVMVFLIFVCKKKVLVAFQKKLGIRAMGFRPKTPGSTTLSTLDLNSTSMSRHNGKMMKSNSAASNLYTIKN